MAERPSSLVSRSIHGREQAIERIGLAMAESRRGNGMTLLLAGEAGIGKSRLVARAIEDALREDRTVLQAAVFPEDRAYPNVVLVDLLRAFLTACPGAAQSALSAVGGDVVRLVPEEASRFTEAIANTESDRRRLFVECASAIGSAGDASPVLLVVEDLHWADEASLDFLLVLAREVAGKAVLLLLTCRDDEAGPGLLRFLAELDRQHLASELRLERLTAPQVDAMVRDILSGGRAVRSDVVQALAGLSDGNPFFVEELLRSVVSQSEAEPMRLDGLPVPRSVHEAVQRRAAGLSPEAHRLLQLAATIGVRFDFDLLRAVSGLKDEEMLALIKELIACQLVKEEAEDVFVFRHALTTQAVSEGLLTRERRLLHGRVVVALEGLRAHDEGAVDLLAYHAYHAGEWSKAIEYLQRAGLRAIRLYAPAVAVDDFNRALDASERLGLRAAPALLYGRATAFDALGDFEQAAAGYEATITAAEESGEAGLAWRATLDLGLLWASRDYAAALSFYERAVRLARALGDAAALPRSLMRLGNWYANTGDFAAARAYIEEALASFRALGDRQAEAEALDVLGMACIMGAVPVESARHYRSAIPILEAANDRRTLSSTLATLAVCSGTYQTDILVPAMTLAEGRGFAERALEVARGTGSRQDECYALWQLGYVLGPMGEYGDALRVVREALAIGEEIEHEQWTCAALIVLGAVMLDLFQLDEARATLERAHRLAHQLQSAIWVQQSAYFLADVYVLQGDVARAQALLDGAPLGSGTDSLARRWHQGGRLAVALAEGDVDEVMPLLDDLADLASPDDPEHIVLRLSLARARALLKDQRPAEAAREAGALIGAAAAHGHLSLLWRGHAIRATALFAQQDRDGARSEANAALDLIDRLASSTGDEALAGSFRQRAALLLPASIRRRGRAPSAGVLTEREAEIAALIARGLSNRAIADELVLSARTVETHVANAMGKLEFSSRAQLAAWAIEQRER